MHRQKCDADEETRTGKIPDLLITHHTTDILAEEELETFVESMNEFYVLLLHPVSIVGLKGLWFQWTDALVDFVVPGNFGDEVSHVGETPCEIQSGRVCQSE